MGEAHGQAPGPLVAPAGEAKDLRLAVEGDLVIVLELVGDLGDAGSGHRAEVVIPPVDPLAGLAIVRGPAEVGRIDIRGEARLEAMQLDRKSTRLNSSH